VVEVLSAWSYQPGTPFREFARRTIEIRDKCRADDDKIGESMCKAMANALGGRLARTFRGWTSQPDKPCYERWGEWCEADSLTGDPIRCRGIAGVRQVHVTRDERQPGLAACYAHLTAYGRVRLDRVIRAAGPGSVLHCDTDGLFVTDTGLAAIRSAGIPVDGSAGHLRVIEEVKSFAGRTPKHFRHSGRWILSGIRGDMSPVGGHSMKSYVSANPVRSGVEPTAPVVPTHAHVYRLDQIPLSGVPGPDGWIVHPTVENGKVRQWRPEREETDPWDEYL
jgi:hypothetical protein